MDLEKLSNILGADTVKKIYEDAASPAVQEAGKIAADTVKALRLFTAPIQLLAHYQERLTKYFTRLQETVPEDKQIQAPPQIAGPIIEKFKYLDENNYLTEVYLSLLQKAINKDEVSKAHPAFFTVIEQLSADEVLILHHLKNDDIKYQVTHDVRFVPEKKEAEIYNKDVIGISLDLGSLNNKDYFEMSLDHMKRLGVISNKTKQEPVFNDPDTMREQIGLVRTDVIYLTEFGRLFVDACIGNNKILII